MSNWTQLSTFNLIITNINKKWILAFYRKNFVHAGHLTPPVDSWNITNGINYHLKISRILKKQLVSLFTISLFIFIVVHLVTLTVWIRVQILNCALPPYLYEFCRTSTKIHRKNVKKYSHSYAWFSHFHNYLKANRREVQLYRFCSSSDQFFLVESVSRMCTTIILFSEDWIPSLIFLLPLWLNLRAYRGTNVFMHPGLTLTLSCSSAWCCLAVVIFLYSILRGFEKKIYSWVKNLLSAGRGSMVTSHNMKT